MKFQFQASGGLILRAIVVTVIGACWAFPPRRSARGHPPRAHWLTVTNGWNGEVGAGEDVVAQSRSRVRIVPDAGAQLRSCRSMIGHRHAYARLELSVDFAIVIGIVVEQAVVLRSGQAPQ